MSDKIAVLGATGVLGRHLVPRLTGAGHEVRVLVRRPEAAGGLRDCGAEVRAADIFDAASLEAGLAGCGVCINLATSLPGPSGRGDYAVNDRIRKEGVPVLIGTCERAGVPRLLQQSIAMVEIEPGVAAPEGPTASAYDAIHVMEAAVKASPLDWLILRGGLFYGPGTGFDDDWFARAAAGKLRLPGDGEGFVSLIHIADMASAVTAAVDRWPSRQVIAVTDGKPARWREVMGHVAASVGSEPRAGGRDGFPSFRVGNEAAREALGWSPAYPDFKIGLAR